MSLDFPQPNTDSNSAVKASRSPVFSVALICIIIAILLLGGFWAYLRWLGLSSQENRSSYALLLESSQVFGDAEKLLMSGNPEQALLKFKESLSSAGDPFQEGQIKFKIAVATADSTEGTNYLAAIPLYKEIAANAAYSKIMRAQAVEEMGVLFARYGDKNITTEIFSTEPYTSMYEPKSSGTSYRKLFEYATSLYPLATSELKIADWYAAHVLSTARSLTKAAGIPLIQFATDAGQMAMRANLLKAGKDADAVLAIPKQELDIIREHIRSADADMERIKDLPNENKMLPQMLNRKGTIAAKMQLIGHDSFGDAEAIFQQLLTLNAAKGSPGDDGYTRYYYAQFLANRYGEARVEDVREILSPFYTTNKYHGDSVEHFFKNERSNTLKVKSVLVRLARIDQEFKAYLITLGWKEADFK